VSFIYFVHLKKKLMPKIFLIIVLLALTFLTKAQSYFEGNIKYKVVLYDVKAGLTPSINIDYGKGLYYSHATSDAGNEELLATDKDNKAYKINKENNTYVVLEMNPNPSFIFEKTTEQKRYFGKTITKYIIEKDGNSITYAWYGNDFKTHCNTDSCTNNKPPFVVNGYIALIVESYRNNQKEYGIYATDIEPKQYDENFFSLANYKNEKAIVKEKIGDEPAPPPPPTEVAEPANYGTGQDEPIKIYEKVEIDAEFNGDWKNYVTNNLKYPVDVPNKPDCKCTVTFVVRKDGSIVLPVNDIKCTVADNRFVTAARSFITNTNDKWKPAVQNGVKVNSIKEVVLTFTYQKK
jgi:hypothetical protein